MALAMEFTTSHPADALAEELTYLKPKEKVFIGVSGDHRYPNRSWVALTVDPEDDIYSLNSNGLFVPSTNHASLAVTKPGESESTVSFDYNLLNLADKFPRHLGNTANKSKDSLTTFSLLKGQAAIEQLKTERRNDEDEKLTAMLYLRGLAMQNSTEIAPVIYPTKAENNLGPTPLGHVRSL